MLADQEGTVSYPVSMSTERQMKLQFDPDSFPFYGSRKFLGTVTHNVSAVFKVASVV